MNSTLFLRALVAICLCIALQAGGTLSEAVAAETGTATKAAAKPAAAPKPAAKTKPAKKTAAAKKSTPAKAAASETGDAVHDKLLTFARGTIASMNRCILPSAGKKEVTQNSDGSYTCRYKEVDPASLKTSYNKPETSKAITYVGHMSYTELEYKNTAKTRNEAMAGPFAVSSRQNLRELVKYTGGKWTY